MLAAPPTVRFRIGCSDSPKASSERSRADTTMLLSLMPPPLPCSPDRVCVSLFCAPAEGEGKGEKEEGKRKKKRKEEEREKEKKKTERTEARCPIARSCGCLRMDSRQVRCGGAWRAACGVPGLCFVRDPRAGTYQYIRYYHTLLDVSTNLNPPILSMLYSFVRALEVTSEIFYSSYTLNWKDRES